MNQIAGNLAGANLHAEFSRVVEENSPLDMFQRGPGRKIEVYGARITGTGTVNLNVFRIVGLVDVVSQLAQITEITTLTNLTDMYADLWDGSTPKILTKTTGADLSGLPVGSAFAKTGIVTLPYEVGDASAPIFFETANWSRSYPFTAGQAGSTETFMRLNFKTTDSPVDFKANIFFTWIPVNGGYMELVTP